MTISDLIDSAEPVAVPIEYVLEREGVRFEEEFRGELHYWCPFHEGSTRPTFALWKYSGVEYVRCFTCGFGPTGLVGYLREAHGVGFNDALGLVRKYARTLPADWTPTKLESKRERGKARSFQVEVDMALTHSKGAARRFLKKRKLADLTEWLLDEFRIGGDEKWVAVPHFTTDGKHPTAMKYRPVDGELRTMSEGVLSFLYGAWRDPGAGIIIVAEGESDTWRIAAWLERRGLTDRVCVVGLPSGASGPKLHWTKWLRGRKTILFFDGDEHAGQRAAARWTAELPGIINVDPGRGTGEEVDACMLSDSALDELIGVHLG